MKHICLFALTALLCLAAPVQAATDRYSFDPAHTQIIFSVSHLGFSHSHGRFIKFSGGFSFDAGAPEKSSIDVTIDTDSLRMDSAPWEDHLKNADFLNVEKFPTMVFKNTHIETTGENTGKITGDLTLLGVTKPVTLDVTYNKSGVHPYSKNFVSGFSAKGTLQRSDFGMDYGLPAIGDTVNLTIEVEGIRQDFDSIKKK